MFAMLTCEVREPLSCEGEAEAHTQDGDDEPLKNNGPSVHTSARIHERELIKMRRDPT